MQSSASACNNKRRETSDYVHIPVYMPAGKCVCAARSTVHVQQRLESPFVRAVRMPVSHTGRPPVSPSPLHSALSLSD